MVFQLTYFRNIYRCLLSIEPASSRDKVAFYNHIIKIENITTRNIDVQ